MNDRPAMNQNSRTRLVTTILVGALVACLLALFAASCVTPDQLDTMKQATEQRDTAVAGARDQLAAGGITAEDAARLVEAAYKTWAAQMKDAVKPAFDWQTLLQSAVVTLVGGAGLNAYRNKTREVALANMKPS